MMADRSAMVLFSGGQDSTVCLAWALDRYAHVETVGFAYGQRHGVELAQRPVVRAEIAARFPQWAPRLGDDHLLDLAALGQISDTALTREAQFEMTAAGLPNTFVPGRNLLFFTYAAALAYRRGIRILVGGMCETDFSGYPDCRNETLQSLAKSIALGMDAAFTIATPLMWIDKAATWEMAVRLGGPALVDLIIAHTHTCYTPDRSIRHAWGYGCGQCPACGLRARGWERWQIART
ncbi:MAG: 7-cyano-7-deazaguanine synthase QueC [Hyphomonadaceae bacterium]|jgi:7-cyano-7-deazaguanine synthase|nr:7-cyano-7-deazaguanine synthase QueC [Hyphomonadaceae bacterium]